MKFIELFAGIGGFRYGLEMCRKQEPIGKRTIGECVPPKRDISISNVRGRKSESQEGHRLLNGVYTCVWANEIDKYACQIYRKNFGEEELYEGDITKVNTDDIPDFDLLTGGFPCQSFSIAGKRRGFDDTRGTMFFEIERICRAKKPRYILLENVKGLLSHDSGKTFQTILKVLSEIGYVLQWQVLNSKNFGVPQNRERVFIIGHLRGTSRPEVFPIGEDTGEITKSTLGKSVKSSARGFGASGSLINKDSITPTLTKSMGTGGNNVPMVKAIKRSGDLGKQKVDLGDIMGSLCANPSSDGVPMVKGTKIRRLTPTECERLQGFPDGWTEGVSDTQRYKALGNAVTTNVITEIGRRSK